MTFALLLLLVGGFLLGGAWSVWSTDEDRPHRSRLQILMAVVVLAAALLATAAGILRLV